MRKIAALAQNTLRESLRSQVLYSIIVFAILLVLAAALFGRVTIGDQIKVIKDFGLFSISIFSVAFAIISGALLLHKELTRKTVYNILAKPVTRSEFVIGKFLGLFANALSVIVILGLLLVASCAIAEGQLDRLLIQSLYYIALETMIICAATIFFSAIVVTPILSGLFSLGLFIVGRSSSYLLKMSDSLAETGAELGSSALRGLYPILPHLDQLNVSNDAVAGLIDVFSGSRAVWAVLYSGGYSLVLLLLAVIIFARREFN